MKVVIILTELEEKMLKSLLNSGLYSNRTELCRSCIREIMIEFRRNGYTDMTMKGSEDDI